MPRLARPYRIERPAASQEAWPGVAPAGREAQRQEPRWNADRRARSAGRAAVPQHGIMKHCVCRRSASPRLIVVVLILKSQAIGAGQSGRRSIQAGFLGSDKAKLGRARVARTVSHVAIAFHVVAGLDPAIHDEVGLDGRLGMDHRVEPGGDDSAGEMSRQISRILVPRRGLEPPRLAALVPETSASTNSATWAPVRASAGIGTERAWRCQSTPHRMVWAGFTGCCGGRAHAGRDRRGKRGGCP